MRTICAGFVGFGEVNTPRELIEQKCSEAVAELQKLDIDLRVTEPVSDDPAGKEADRAILDLQGSPLDFLVVCIAGWIPSHAVLKVTQEFAHVPMLLWGLTGSIHNGRLVTTADQAGTTALRSVFKNMGYIFSYVYSTVDNGHPVRNIEAFAKAARAVDLLKHGKVGMMGYRDMNLYGTMFDGMSLKKAVGVEIEFFEMLEIVQRMETLERDEIKQVIDQVKNSWTFENKAADATLEKGVKLYLGVKSKVLERGYDAVSLIDVDGVKKLLQFTPAMAFMLLGEDPGVCTIPENDALGSVTQLLTRYLTGQAAPYFEFYEFMQDRVLMGVPDFVPSSVVDGEVTVKATAFGGFGEGILNISKVKTGPVTLARLNCENGKYSLHIVTGEAVIPRSWEEAGWEPPAPQLPSLEIILDIPVDEFAQEVLSQHYILSYGDTTPLFQEACRILGFRMY